MLPAEIRDALHSALHSAKPDARTITRALSFALLEQCKDQKHFAYVLAKELIELTYPAVGVTDTDDARNRLIIKASQELSKDAQDVLMHFMARIGHLHQIAAFMARDQLLEQHSEEKPIDRLIGGSPRVMDAVEALNRPVMEFTFTAHPTNTNSVAFMRAQRILGLALGDWQKDETKEIALTRALQRFAHTPIFPMHDGKASPLSVAEETDYMLYFLHNAFDDLDAVYRGYDAALSKAYGGRYDPMMLKLNLAFHSWGSSGDKDGNSSVNANTTLHAIAEHRLSVLMRYKTELDALEHHAPELQVWRDRIQKAVSEISAVVNKVNHTVLAEQPIPSADFDKLRDALKAASAPLDAKAFERDLTAAYQHSNSATHEKLLSLVRKAHHFGFTLGTIEYRETAEEYARVVAELIPDYQGMNEQERQAALNDLLAPQSRAKLDAAVQALQVRMQGKEGGSYSKDDALPIACHTLKRMELARDFPDVVQNNVLAECQNTSNFLEALLLQHAAAKDGVRATLGIIPLFEEYGVLARAPEIVKAARENPAYAQHQQELAALSDGRGQQQVQLAHSDNARRAGSIGSRAAIYQAQDALQRMGVRRYQGGSQSDAYRDGVRAMSGKINEFALHDFTKMTFQGGDLLNYFNLPQSSVRLISRNLSANALAIKHRKRHSIMTSEDQAVLPALMETIPGYESLFQDERFSDFVGEAGYTEQQRAGNFSSRASARAGAPAKVSVPNTRTISYSETLEHAGIVPIWIGAKGLRDSLQHHLAQGGPLTPGLLHHYYEKSPLFKDVVDRLLFSAARSSFSPLQRMNGHPLMQRLTEEYDEAFGIAVEAYTGKEADSFTLKEAAKPAVGKAGEERRLVIQEAFNHTQDFFADQDRFMRNVHAMRALWLPKDWDNAMGNAVLHNMTDTVHHGRNWLIDDPGAAKIHCQVHGIERPYTNGVDNGKGRGA